MAKMTPTQRPTRYIFFLKGSGDDFAFEYAIQKATKILTDLGATVVDTGHSSLLVQADPALLDTLIAALPGWNYTIERWYQKSDKVADDDDDQV
jgi:hypothetical protein